MNATEVRPKTTAKAKLSWPAIFPEQATQTYSNSIVFMKQLTLVAVSTITYVKNALPEDCYTIDTLGGIKLRVLKTDTDDDLARFLYNALTQAFVAFEKQFLQQLVLCFYSAECLPENLLEFHVFEYQYGDGNVTMSVSSKSRDCEGGSSFKCDMEDVKDRTVMLIRSCMVMVETFRQLPEAYDVSIRLYYNDNAPKGYQVPGFHPASHLDDPTDVPYFVSTKLGALATPYHSLMLTSFTKDTYFAKDTYGASREALASQNAPAMTSTQTLDRGVTSGSMGPSLSCVCPSIDIAMDSPLLTCHYCKTRQHAICYGVLAGSIGRVGLHCCVQCSEREPMVPPTDLMLRQQPPEKRACVAVFRCTIAWCSTIKAVSIKDLSTKLNLTEFSATKLMKSLANTGIVSAMPDNKDRAITRLKIDRNRLSAVMKDYFPTFEDDDLINRLMEETLASQEIQPDPIADVLGPMKQVSLQKASNIGRVVDSMDTNNNIDDPTLKLYKEAFVKIDKNELELILSGSSNPVKDLKTAGNKRKNNGDDKKGKVGVATKKVKMTQRRKKN